MNKLSLGVMLNMVRHYFGYSDSQIVQELRTDAILGGEDKLIENLAELLHKGLHIIIDELEGVSFKRRDYERFIYCRKDC